MAASASDAHPYPVYNARFRVTAPLMDADGDLVSAASTPDSEISKDAGTFADCTNEMTELATASGVYSLDLTSTELTCQTAAVILKSATAGMKTTTLVLYPARLPVIRTGTAQAGAASTITLDSGASALTDYYVGAFVNITNNSPANAQGQCRRVTAYNGSTKVATVEGTYGTNPSSASTFEVLATAEWSWRLADLTAIEGIALATHAAGLLPSDVRQYGGSAGTFAGGRPEVNVSHFGGTAGTFASGRAEVNVSHFGGTAGTFAAGRPEANTTHIAGSAVSTTTAQIGCNVVQISTDSVAADNLENAFDDTAGANRWTGIIDQGTAQAATGTTLQLRAAAAFADSELNNCWVLITGGTLGVGQVRRITGYVGATDTATVDAWTTTPTGTITYQVLPAAAVSADVTKFGGTAATTAAGRPEVNTTHFGGSAGTFAAGRPETNMTHIAGVAVSTSTAQLGVNVVNYGGSAGTFAAGRPEVNTTHAAGTAWGSGAITAASIASSAITAAKFAAGAIDAAAIATDAIGSAELAATAATEIAAAVWDELTSGHVVSGSFGQALFRLRTGTAQTGANGSITLDASASAVDDFYKNAVIVLTSGTGVNQARTISGYTGTSKIATVTPNWGTNPANDSVFTILPAGSIAGATAPTAAEVADAVWDEARSGHVTSGSFGEGVASVQGNVTGSTASVTGAVGSVTGNVGGNVVGSVASVTGAVGSVTGNVGGNVVGSTASVTGAVGSVTGNVGGNVTGSVGSVVGAVGSVTGAVGSVTGNIGGNVTGSVGSVATGGIAAASFAAGAIDASAIATDAIGSSELAASAVSEITVAVWAETTRTLTNGAGIKKNTAQVAFPFKMVDATDGFTAKTGVTVTATRSLDGAAFAACANGAAEVASGWYKITLAAADLNADTVVLRFTGSGCRDTEFVFVTEP